jgi:hypothetical protein
MKKLNVFSLLVALALLSGCKSEVDKCVEVNMSGYDANKKPYDDRPRAQVEGLARLICMEAANKR